MFVNMARTTPAQWSTTGNETQLAISIPANFFLAFVFVFEKQLRATSARQSAKLSSL
jgi:tRNA A37 threonylcarbamoyladenosine synthetase subunit TsaC/SUA5/YrdC